MSDTPKPTAKIDGNKRSAREHQRHAAQKILDAMKRGSGTSLTADEVYHLWAGLMDALNDFADTEI